MIQGINFILTGYKQKCAITGNVIQYKSFMNLEAAHIWPRSHKGLYLPSNGIALCRDMHWAFDKGMFTIGDDFKVIVHPDVESDYLQQYNNKSLYIPENAFFRPDINNLHYHQTHIYGLFKTSGSLVKATGSLEPEYFCSLIELCYKERNGEKREIELNKSLSDRLYEILFQFKVIPGIDWNGNFDAKRFDYWMKTVKTWSRDNDRYEVAMHTVGSGLSYAELDEDKLPQTAVIEELNRVENEELRRGYYLGIINQRGVHWIDPEGKPELELAEDYENRANIAESRGYSRYAGILRVIGDEFKREAKSNILEAKNGDDE